MDIPPNFRCPYKTSPAQAETFYRMVIILTFTAPYISKEICNRLQIKRPKPTFSTSSPQRHRLNPLASPFTFPAACQLVTRVNKIQQVTHQPVPVHNRLHLAFFFFFSSSQRGRENGCLGRNSFPEHLLPCTGTCQTAPSTSAQSSLHAFSPSRAVCLRNAAPTGSRSPCGHNQAVLQKRKAAYMGCEGTSTHESCHRISVWPLWLQR